MADTLTPWRVKTVQGDLEGTLVDTLAVFKGVAYAQPPISGLRFKAPRPLEPWSGVRPARMSGPASYQMYPENQEAVKRYAKALDPGVRGGDIYPAFVANTYAPQQASEDCLYLEIWAPKDAVGRGLPVYVYYHGGANWNNTASFSLERGEILAREADVIVVRPNYRLGALGWVHFGLVSDAFPEAINLGLQDQIAALRWVRENIEAFGGDPSNITIGGESCGATAVSHFLTKEDAATVASMYKELLGLSDYTDLASIDHDKLLATANLLMTFFEPDKNHAWRPLGAFVDGNLVPHMPVAYLATADLSDNTLQVMMGCAKDEWQAFRGGSPTIQHGSEEDVLGVLRQVFGTRSGDLLQRYQKLYPDRQSGRLLSDIMSFEFFKFSTLQICRNLSRQGILTYMFEFAYDMPGLGGMLRAVHTGDMPFIWRTCSGTGLAKWPTLQGADSDEVARLAKQFGDLYTSFIRSGDPGERWTPFSASEAGLWFGKVIETRSGILSEEDHVFRTGGGISNVDALYSALTGSLSLNLVARQQVPFLPRKIIRYRGKLHRRNRMERADQIVLPASSLLQVLCHDLRNQVMM